MSHAKVALAIEVPVTELLLEIRQRCPSSRLQKTHSILQNKAPRQNLPFCTLKLFGILVLFVQVVFWLVLF